MKKAMFLMLASMFVFGALTLAACGDDDDDAVDNVGACEDWVAAMECGEYDMGEYVDCSVYADYACDIADYFNCLTDNTTCDETTDPPTLDMSGWTECYDLASCE